MPLPQTGPISMSQIKAELGSSSNSLRAYSLQAGFSTPDSMTEFLGYSALGGFRFADWTGTVSVNLNGIVSYTLGNSTAVSVSPTTFDLVRVNTTQTINVTVRVPSGYSNSGTNVTGTKTAVQPPKLFAYADWVSSGGSVSINKNSGVVSFTNGTLGTVSSVSPTSFDLVTSPTSRNVTVNVTAPSGYGNTGDTLTGTFTVTQAALDETITITLNGSGNTWYPSGQGDSTQLAIDVVNIFNTSWTVEVSDTDWLSVVSSTGTGDGTTILAVSPNYTGQPDYNGNARSGWVRVYKTSDSGIFDEVSLYQEVGVAPPVAPTVSLTPPNNPHIAWNEFGNQYVYKTYVGTWTGGTTPTQGSFYMNSSEFVFVSTDDNVIITEPSTGNWVGTITNPGASPYSVGVYAKEANNSPTNQKTATITFTLSNTAGTNSTTARITQLVAPPIFTFADAGASGFAVSQNGTITAPTVSAGYISSVTYIGSNSNIFYSIVGTNTTRTATVYVTVPSGYSNSGNTVSGDISTTQVLTPSFTFGDWTGGVVSINQNGQVSASSGNSPLVVSLSPANFDKVYTPTDRTITVTVRVPSGYFNSGGNVFGDVTVTQPAAPADPTVTVYTLCGTGTNYFIEGEYNYNNIEILGTCAYRSETTTKSVALSSGFTEFFSISPSSCEC